MPWGAPDLREDPRFVDRNARAEHYNELYEELTPLFKQRTRDEWLALFEQHDVPGAPAYRVNELVEDPQFAHQGIRIEHSHPEGDSVTAKNPLNLLGTPLTYDVPPPGLGEHNDEVLSRLGLSYGRDRIPAAGRRHRRARTRPPPALEQRDGRADRASQFLRCRAGLRRHPRGRRTRDEGPAWSTPSGAPSAGRTGSR